MMNKKIGFLLLVLIFALPLAYKKLYKNKTQINNNDQPKEYLSDLSLLQNKNAEEKLLIPAMTRLALRQNPDAKMRLIQRLNSNDFKISISAAQSLGYFSDDEVLRVLQNRLQTADSALRLAIFQGFGAQYTKGRKEFFENVTRSLKLNDQEMFFKNYAIYRLEKDPKAKEVVANELINAYKKNADANFEIKMLSILATQIGHRDFLEKRIVEILKSGTNQDLILVALRALKTQCPADRYIYFKNYISPKITSAVQRDVALQELIFHPGKGADEILSGLDPKLVSSSTFEKVHTYFAGRQQLNPCALIIKNNSLPNQKN